MEIIRNAAIDAMLSRRSVRRYTPEKVSEAELDTILQCGLWAPSARNAQTTMLVLIGRDLLDELEREYMSTLVKAPKFMAGGFSYGAPHLIIAYDKDGTRWSGVNAALAVENMTIAASALGLGSVQLGIIREFMLSEAGRRWQKRFGVPDDYSFALSVAVGHQDGEAVTQPRNEANIIKL